jgi:hypothetical protein
MQKWEHKVVQIIEYEADKIEPQLRRLGEEGWELVSVDVDKYLYFLKRPKS